MMQKIKLVFGFLNGLLIKIFPFLGYKGVVDQQIKIYRKFKEEGYNEQETLNNILGLRKRFSNDVGSDSYYDELITEQNKTLEKTIMSIVEWEYLSNMNAYRIRSENNIPLEFIEQYRQEMSNYIHSKIESIQ